MKRSVIEIYCRADESQVKRDSHFFSPSADKVYAKLREIIWNGTQAQLTRQLSYMKQKGYSIDKQCYPDQQTALHLAVATDKSSKVDALLKAGATSIADENDTYPIFLAVKHQKFNSLRYLLAMAPLSYKTVCVKNRTLLHMAVFWGVGNVVEFLLNSFGADKEFVNAKDSNGNTPLHYVHMADDEKIVQALLDASADPLMPNECGVTPLFQAAINDAVASVACLLSAVKQINYAQSGIRQRNLLHVAAHFASTNVLRFLLNQYKNDKDFLNARDEEGATPLHVAARSGVEQVYGLLLRAGADATIADHFNTIPARIAQARNCYTDYDSAPELISSQYSHLLATLGEWLKSIKDTREESSDDSAPSMVVARV